MSKIRCPEQGRGAGGGGLKAVTGEAAPTTLVGMVTMHCGGACTGAPAGTMQLHGEGGRTQPPGGMLMLPGADRGGSVVGGAFTTIWQ
eukprot:2906684-Amphidinium_carterae.1